MKIRSKILIGFLPIALLSIGIMTLFARRAVERVLIHEVTLRGLSVGQKLIREREMRANLATGEERLLLPILQELMADADGLYAIAIDREGRVLAHTNVVEKGKRYGAEPEGLKPHDPVVSRRIEDGVEVIDISFPVWAGAGKGKGEEYLLLGGEVPTGERLGTVRLGLSLQEALETATQISRQVFWVISWVSLLTMTLVLFYVGRLLRPARVLAAATERIGRGGVGETVPVLSGDEMGDLAVSFNRMSRELAATTVSKDFLDSILKNMRDILLVTDVEGRLSLLNRRALLLLGYGEGELEGQPIELLFGEGEDPSSPEWKGEEGHSFESRLCTREGEEIPVLLGVTPFSGPDAEVKGVAYTATDITERKRAEEEIRLSLEEKELLLKEIHHRVKNNLQVISSLLSLQAGRIDDEKVLEMFDNSQNRVMSMALIHEKLYRSDELARVNFADYIGDLTDNLFRSYRVEDAHVSLELEMEEVLLGIDEAIPVGLIVNELVLNSLKHAFPDRREGRIWIRMGPQADGRCRLIVGDDGVGVPEGVDLTASDSLGLKLVRVLVVQLGGKMEIERQGGMEFRIEFPL